MRRFGEPHEIASAVVHLLVGGAAELRLPVGQFLEPGPSDPKL
ncbi:MULTISPECIES: hypothetical protein [unclassified Streptomyces]